MLKNVIVLPYVDYEKLKVLIESPWAPHDFVRPQDHFKSMVKQELDSLNPEFDEVLSRVHYYLEAIVLDAKKKFPSYEEPSSATHEFTMLSGRCPVSLSHLERTDCDFKPIRGLPSDVIFNDPSVKPYLARLFDAADTLDLIRRCVVDNCLSTIALLKKHDSLLSTSLQEELVVELSQQAWVASPVLPGLCARTLSLVHYLLEMSLPTPLLTAMEGCPVCLHDMTSPIRLPCNHRFCWACVVGARASGLQSCPMCRQQHSLDPRRYALEPILSPLISLYFPTYAMPATSPVAAKASPPLTPIQAPAVHSKLIGEEEATTPSDAKVVRVEALSRIGDAPALALPSPQRRVSSMSPRPLNPSAAAFVPTCVKVSPASEPKIRYSISELMALRPLNPNAREFVPGSLPLPIESPFLSASPLSWSQLDEFSLAKLEDETGGCSTASPAVIAEVEVSVAPRGPAGSKRKGSKRSDTHTKQSRDNKWEALGRVRTVSCV